LVPTQVTKVSGATPAQFDYLVFNFVGSLILSTSAYLPNGIFGKCQGPTTQSEENFMKTPRSFCKDKPRFLQKIEAK